MKLKMSQKLPKNGYHEVMNNPNCYDFSYYVLFTYVFSLFLEVSHGAATCKNGNKGKNDIRIYTHK